MPKTVVESYKLYEGHPDLPDGQKFIEVLYYPTSHAYKVGGEKLIGVSGVSDHIEKPGLRFYYMNEAIGYLTRSLVPANDGVFQLPESADAWKTTCTEAKSAHKVRSDRGKENGTRTHSWLELFLIAKRDKTEVPALPEQFDIPKSTPGMSYEQLTEIEVKKEFNNLVEALSQFIDWHEKHDVEVVALERLVFSLDHRYAGRFDAILKIDGKTYLVDFKTNNPTADYPNGIYPEMFCQIGGYDVAWTQEMAPEKHHKNESGLDGHAVFNFNKKTGKFYKHYQEGDDLKLNRNWFIHVLASKRTQQHKVRTMSMMYKENRKQKRI